MENMKNKKSDVAVAKLIGLALGVIVLVIVGIFIYQQITGQKEETIKLTLGTRDYDEDGIANIYDKCACVDGVEENDGCPISVNIDAEPRPSEMTDDACRDKISAST
tara:strand:- start:319 stop:639 length:321 start_codon:yes stop_codon:yes gene_type:complete